MDGLVENDRIAWFGRELEAHLAPSPDRGRDPQPGLGHLQELCTHSSSGNLGQGLTSPIVQNFLLTSNLIHEFVSKKIPLYIYINVDFSKRSFLVIVRQSFPMYRAHNLGHTGHKSQRKQSYGESGRLADIFSFFLSLFKIKLFV